MPCFPTSYACDHDSYLAVQFLDGHVEHLMGPAQVWFSRWKHVSITVTEHRRYTASESMCVVIVWRDGTSERRMGPCMVTLDPLTMSSCKTEQLRRYMASQTEYLVVQFNDGRKEHMRGPLQLVFDPLVHEQITVNEAIRLAANEAIVVYRRHETSAENLVAKLEIVPTAASKKAAAATKASASSAGGVTPAEPLTSTTPPPPLLTAETAGQEGAVHVERRVVHGPAVFMPDENEWLHTFSWHGSKDKDGKGSKTGYAGDVKVPHALNFTVIRCMPDNMYLTVRDVRSVDDAKLNVEIMLFYELKSIETMLDSTNDMIGDFVNAASADVMTFAARLSYEQFLQETAELSRVANFPILAARMEQTGVELLKVVYRGYSAAPALQQMHDEAISRRTKLRLEADAAREEQEKLSLQLRCRQERSVQENRMETEKAKHTLEVKAMQKAQERRLEDEDHSQMLRYAQEKAEMSLANERELHNEMLRREREGAAIRAEQLATERESDVKKYEALKAMGVDLTQYLCALSTARPDQHLRIESAGGAPPAVHIDIPKKNGNGHAIGLH